MSSNGETEELSAEASKKNRPLSKGRLILADDDEDLREALALAMRSEGYEVVELEDGSQLLHYLATDMLVRSECAPVDLVISDLCMPGKSGLDVLAGVQWALNPPPFILVTGFATPDTRAEASRLGAAALVTKPFCLDQMRTLVREIEARRMV